nr:DUF2062 domain-containing protein [Mesorhizobium sp. SP-1A]
MLFRRRETESLWERLRVWLWPRRSFSRSLQYFSKRILRLNASPHAVAAGVAAGIFASFFPLGLHFIIAAVICWVVAGNLVAALLGAAVGGNPLTVPLLWGASWETGKLVMHRHLPAHGAPVDLGGMMQHLSFQQLWKPILEPMAIGATLLGIIFGLICYALTRWAMNVFREQRRRRRAERAHSRDKLSGTTGGIGSATR